MLRSYYRTKSYKEGNSFRKVCALLSIFLLGGCVFLAIQATLVFSKISFLEKEENKLLQERSSLQEKLFKTDSLNSVISLSAQKGFVENVKMVYLSGDKPIAKLP